MADRKYTVEPDADENHEGRQSGWRVLRGDDVVLEASWGGTGPCWNLASGHEDADDCMLHVCELPPFIEALLEIRSGRNEFGYHPELDLLNVTRDEGGSLDIWGYSNSETPDDETADPSRLHVADIDVMIEAVQALYRSDAQRLNEEQWS